MKYIFEVFGGIIGLAIFLVSVILFFIIGAEEALFIALFTLVTLSPFVTINSFREKINDFESLSQAWFGKLGSIFLFANFLSTFWFGFLTFQLTDSLVYAIIIVLIKFLILPRIYLLIYNKFF